MAMREDTEHASHIYEIVPGYGADKWNQGQGKETLTQIEVGDSIEAMEDREGKMVTLQFSGLDQIKQHIIQKTGDTVKIQLLRYPVSQLCLACCLRAGN